MLNSNETVDYQIYIKDKNRAPKNFKFYIEEPIGRINKNETKAIEVKWKWEYESEQNQNIEDTKDGEELKEYNFEIRVKGGAK